MTQYPKVNADTLHVDGDMDAANGTFRNTVTAAALVGTIAPGTITGATTFTGNVAQQGNETFAAAKSLTLGAAATGTQVMTDLLETFTSANGAQLVTGWNEELVTLATGATTTDTVGNLLPAGAVILAVTARVVTTITTASNWSVGDSTTAARFSAANSTLVAGTTSVGLAHMSGAVTTLATGPTQAAAAKVRITTNVNPGAGAIRVTVFYQQFVPATA